MKVYFTVENLVCFGRCHVKPTCMRYDQDVLFWKMSYSAHMYKVQIKLKRDFILFNIYGRKNKTSKLLISVTPII